MCVHTLTGKKCSCSSVSNCGLTQTLSTICISQLHRLSAMVRVIHCLKFSNLFAVCVVSGKKTWRWRHGRGVQKGPHQHREGYTRGCRCPQLLYRFPESPLLHKELQHNSAGTIRSTGIFRPAVGRSTAAGPSAEICCHITLVYRATIYIALCSQSMPT